MTGHGWSSSARSVSTVDGPGGYAATEEVAVTGEDCGVKSECERHRGPVVWIARHAAARGRLVICIGAAGNDLDDSLMDEFGDRNCQGMRLFGGDTALVGDYG